MVIKKAVAALQNKKVLYVVVVCVVAVAGYFLFFKNSGSKDATLVVHPGNFLQQVSVSGKVVAAQDVDLGFSQSGRVSRVLWKVGDNVYAGALLAEIENGDLYATILQKQAALESQQAKLLSLRQGTRPEDIAVAQSTVDGSTAALNQANQGIINAISDAYAKSDDVVRNKVEQFISNPRGVNPQLLFTTTASQLAINILTNCSSVEQLLPVWQANIASLNTSSDMSGAVSKAQESLASVAALLSDSGDALSRAVPSQTANQTTIGQYITDIAAARTTINAAISSVNAALTAQKSAVAALDAARKNLTLKQAGTTVADIDAQTAQVKAAQADLENAQAQFAKTRITAPFAGVITKMDAKVGQIISPNTPEISMIGNGAFQVESFVPEINVASIAVGNLATVTLDAYGTDVPFAAKIVSVDPADTIQNGVSTYRAVLQFVVQDPRIKSGMTANVIITTLQKSGVIAVPQGIVAERDGKKFVSVLVGGAAVEREVTTDSVSSLGQIEILSGLSDGDTVVLPLQ